MFTQITLSFLIGFVVKAELEESATKPAEKCGDKKGAAKDAKSERPGKGKREKDKKKEKKRKGSEKGSARKKKSVVEKPKYIIPVKKPIGFARIEWNLLPERPKYFIDVVCWGPIAKVYSEDGDVTLKTYYIEKEEVAWVYVSLKHVFRTMEDLELVRFHAHVINYTILTKKSKLAARAKSQKYKQFFIRQVDVDSNEKFIEAFDYDPNVGVKTEKTENENFIEKIIWECADKPGTRNYTEIVTRSGFVWNYLHRYRMEDIIKKITNQIPVEYKDFVNICPPPSIETDFGDLNETTNAEKSLKNKIPIKNNLKVNIAKNEKKNSKAENSLKIPIPGEVFYTDAPLSIYSSTSSNNTVKHAFILTSVKNLMNRKTKQYLNPLVIKLKKISNLPVDVLKTNRFKEIDLRYDVPYVAQCRSLKKPINKTIKFNEAHAHFTYEIPTLKLVEFMQTRRLYIKICGIRDEYETPIECNMFGTEVNDNNLEKIATARECLRVRKKESAIVTLAVACFDISSIPKPTWDFCEKTPCHHPDNVFFQKTVGSHPGLKISDKLNTNEINLSLIFPIRSESPLTEELLLSSGTTLKVEVFLAAPFIPALSIHSKINLYNRMIIVVNSPEIAKSLVHFIFNYNQEIAGIDILYTKYLIQSQQIFNFSNNENSQTINSILTGFVIDNGNEVVFFLEGPSNGFLGSVWNGIMTINTPVMKTFFNSRYYFENRMYSDFLNYGGLYLVILKKPIKEILNQPRFYVEGNVPIPCFRALQKLDLLFKSCTLKSIIQYNLLPTPNELVSLDLEYGVPNMYVAEEKSEVCEVEKELRRHTDTFVEKNAESLISLR